MNTKFSSAVRSLSPDEAGSTLTANDVAQAPSLARPTTPVVDGDTDVLLDVATMMLKNGANVKIGMAPPRSGQEAVAMIFESLEGRLIIPSAVTIVKGRPQMVDGRPVDRYNIRTNFLVGTVGEIMAGQGRNAGSIGSDFIDPKELSRTHQCIRYHSEVPFMTGQSPTQETGLFTSTRVSTRSVLAERMDSDDAANKVKEILSRYTASIDALYKAAGLPRTAAPTQLLSGSIGAKLAALANKPVATPVAAGQVIEHEGFTDEEAEELIELQAKANPTTKQAKRIAELLEKKEAAA